jgi:hypothetical protein
VRKKARRSFVLPSVNFVWRFIAPAICDVRAGVVVARRHRSFNVGVSFRF